MFADDAGTFSVILQNPIGQACSKSRLTVKAMQDESDGQAPQFIGPPIESKTVELGEHVTFECRVNHECESDSIIWFSVTIY